MVAGVVPGSDVVMEILRGGKRRGVTVRLAELESPVPPSAPRKTPWDSWGLYVKALPKGTERVLGVEGGVEVQLVDPSGPAGTGGVREGDILLRINREPVGDLSSYRRMLAKSPPGHMVSVLVDRDGGQLYLAFRNR